MREEIQSASAFLTKLLSSRLPTGDRGPSQPLRRFGCRMEELLRENYRTHWFPDHPDRGQAYRCIRINQNHRMMDPIVQRAAADCGIANVRALFPRELTLWVDPQEVAYRIGETEGSICVLYRGLKPGGGCAMV